MEVERERNSQERRAETNRQRHDSIRSQDTERKRQDSTQSESDSVKSCSTQNNKNSVEKEKSKNCQNPKDVRTHQDLDAAPDTNRKVRPNDLRDQEAVASITNDNLEEGEEEEGEIPDSEDETAEKPKNVPCHPNKDRRYRKEKENLLRDSNSQDVERTMEQIFSSPTFDEVLSSKSSASEVLTGKSSAEVLTSISSADVLTGKSSTEVLTVKSSTSSQSVATSKLPSHDENKIATDKKSSEAISELKIKASGVQERLEVVESKPVEPEPVELESVLDEEGLISSSGTFNVINT